MAEAFLEGISAVLLPLLLSSWFPFFLLLLLASAILNRKLPVIKGAIGERAVNRKLRKLGAEYTVYHDLYVPNGERGLTQVDHVVTSPFGLFVIETKHYSGWIFGDEYQQDWTQVIYKRKEKLYNPIRQNYGHIQAIKSYMEKEYLSEIHSIIAFSDSVQFKFKNNFKSAKVVHFGNLLDAIKEQHDRKLTVTELQEINQALDRLAGQDKKMKRQLKKEHVQNIKRKIQSRPTGAKSNGQSACPRCGGNLSKRNGKYGEFWGCSNFPKCRYTGKVA